MRDRVFWAAGLIALFALVLMGCSAGGGSLSEITPTPTKTMRPLFTSTFTPTATPLPTETPAPTETPVPATDTPVPTEPPVPPTEEAPTPTALPSDTPVPPTATDTPAPPMPTAAPSVTAAPSATPKPQVDYRVAEQRLMTKVENEAGLYLILIRVVDAGNSPLYGVTVWDPNHPDQEAVSGDKPEPYHAEYMFGGYDAYQLEVKGARSEKTRVLTTDVHKIPKEDLVTAGYCPDVANCNQDELVQHFSWYVTFQRTW
jgi:outer membrane biosynthesis protein TonB